MATPRFSVLIPTRDRPETLRHTLQTVLSQPGDDYEVVVADNCSRDETRALVDSAASSKVRYARSNEVLPMGENWERGLALCSGEYVTVLGDDDAFLPSTLAIARRIAAATSPAILSWIPHTYWWPDTIVYWARSILVVSLQTGLRRVASRPLLEQFYRGEAAFGLTPMIYQAFFHRSLVDEARRRYGAFFVPRQAAPDVSSGILGLHLAESFIHSDRGLTLRGHSGRSNGIAQWARSLGAAQRATYFREERTSLERMIHPALVPSPDLAIIIANAKLWCADTYFPDDSALRLDPRSVIDELVNSLAQEPEAYEEKLADIRSLAAKTGVSLPPIPAPQPLARQRMWGPDVRPDKSVPFLHVNCDAAGVSDVAGAAALAEGLLPPAEAFAGG